jgi:hypothetical protein
MTNDAQTERSSEKVAQAVDVSGYLPLDYCAHMCGVANAVPRLTLEGVLADDGLPFQNFIDWKYFALTQGADGNTDILLTPLGQVWFAKRYHKARVAH